MLVAAALLPDSSRKTAVAYECSIGTCKLLEGLNGSLLGLL